MNGIKNYPFMFAEEAIMDMIYRIVSNEPLKQNLERYSRFDALMDTLMDWFDHNQGFTAPVVVCVK